MRAFSQITKENKKLKTQRTQRFNDTKPYYKNLFFFTCQILPSLGIFLILESQFLPSPNKHGLSNEPPRRKKIASQLQNQSSIQNEIHLRRPTSKNQEKLNKKLLNSNGINWTTTNSNLKTKKEEEIKLEK